MLEIPGFQSLKKILWKDISSGMILVGGVSVNNGLPIEVANYPVLSMSLVSDLTRKYHFKPTKEVVVAIVKKGESPAKMSLGFTSIQKRIQVFNRMKKIYDEQRKLFYSKIGIEFPLPSFYHPEVVAKEFLEHSHCNSFERRIFGSKLPSLFRYSPSVISFGDIIANKNKNWNLPKEKDISLIVGISYTENPNWKEEIQKINQLLKILNEDFKDIFLNLRIQFYVFSETIEKAHYPLTGREIPRTKPDFNQFVNKVLNQKNKEIVNKAILITNDSPTNLDDVILSTYKLKKQGIDFSIYSPEPKNLTTQESLKKIANAGSGNLFILKQIQFLELVFIEIIDHYLGTLSQNSSVFHDPIFNELKPMQKIISNSEETGKKKIIKPFEFKKIQ
ncbi:MAG: hypothetical protein SFU98_14745 [Leptospiraceae bacterium]|nr:hypothetical protein [Leptospiraceae bacterium]